MLSMKIKYYINKSDLNNINFKLYYKIYRII